MNPRLRGALAQGYVAYGLLGAFGAALVAALCCVMTARFDDYPDIPFQGLSGLELHPVGALVGLGLGAFSGACVGLFRRSFGLLVLGAVFGAAGLALRSRCSLPDAIFRWALVGMGTGGVSGVYRAHVARRGHRRMEALPDSEDHRRNSNSSQVAMHE